MKSTLFCLLLVLSTSLMAQQYQYSLDLNQVSNDQVIVNLKVPAMSEDTLLFHFPKTIPGTYATQDYGKYISAFQAKTASGEVIQAIPLTVNTYQIPRGTELASIRYKVDDTFDAGEKKDKVFEPAGTNIQAGRNFVLNNAGFFGFFEGQENWPVALSIDKPSDMIGMTALSQTALSSSNQAFLAASYHQLLDCPIMFSAPDTISFKVANARVTMSVYNQSGRELSGEIYKEVKVSMDAIAEFLDGKLPVDNYAFLFYIEDYTRYQALMSGGKVKVKDVASLIKEMVGQGFGALEHGNSSFYFLPDFGNEFAVNMIKDVCIHEFFHILTPLSLHSQHIGDFDYVEPVMSQHLWLYEGITEYFAGISQLKGGVLTPYEYLSDVLKGNIRGARSFPETEMSFTEMSANVLEKPWSKEYGQVYVRGALLGALLDIEIMRLTAGEKTLKDVVVTLGERYGKDKSFDEDSFIIEFVNEVDPKLQDFFDQYIMGRTPLDVAGGLSPVGVLFQESFQGKAPFNPLSENENDIKTKSAFSLDGSGDITIKKAGKEEAIGLKKGDIFTSDALKGKLRDEYGDWLAEGTVVEIPVIRKGEAVMIEYEIRYVEKTLRDQIYILEGMNPREELLFRRWISNDSLKKIKKELANKN
ncbi:MAG: hypothetical protein AB8H47_18640 [Bacteroidia bacterium]